MFFSFPLIFPFWVVQAIQRGENSVIFTFRAIFSSHQPIATLARFKPSTQST